MNKEELILYKKATALNAIRKLYYPKAEALSCCYQEGETQVGRRDETVRYIVENLEKELKEIKKEQKTSNNCIMEDNNIINKAAHEWVFEKNGEKWSNNDDTAGDNVSSFIAGAKWMLEKIDEGKNEELQKMIKVFKKQYKN